MPKNSKKNSILQSVLKIEHLPAMVIRQEIPLFEHGNHVLVRCGAIEMLRAKMWEAGFEMISHIEANFHKNVKAALCDTTKRNVYFCESTHPQWKTPFASHTLPG